MYNNDLDTQTIVIGALIIKRFFRVCEMYNKPYTTIAIKKISLKSIRNIRERLYRVLEMYIKEIHPINNRD